MGCYFCGCDFAAMRVLPGGVSFRACDACHEEIVTDAMGAPAVEVEREISAAVDALAAW